ncbi:mannose-1-phosphate guanylyltransferase/mannose-6-phosphate isomerase [Sandaracinobacteroides saxicola]|uniref:mannose-1-phosphate guanylyltransferase n=1 Tax=Sandaracinobacteroides saxicola TaxID=2759707 RepID=A0A7G5IKL3_9SPHN|nr:mannose-1-phosphate guanylyltransferase/mannose-6-phosphate isomerase [Sandaracinobacteroides saxicola]QMW23905.1 mannose-1-phosphate guanylyltransferase/mannose-6-phosphate isomerase [Sandaracinobacteroides saxicola]
MSEIVPVLLSGGSGTRLWPLSRADVPKQLQAVAHERTMLQATALRVADGAAPIVVAGDAHRYLVSEQLLGVGVMPAVVILEPEGRNTAPAIALAAQHLAAAGRGAALMLVMPSDHLITDEAAFRAAIATAAAAAADGSLVTFGITPTEAATGYGYIRPVEAAGAVRRVAAFVEKPDAATAEQYLADGYLWNAGIFLFSADAYLAALDGAAPEIAAHVARAVAAGVLDGRFLRPEAAAFAACPSISIDYAVMQTAPHVKVVPVDMGWSDVGSWDALWRVTVPDAEGNVVRGAGTLIGCRDSLVRNENGPFVAALGLDDMIVVSTPDAVMIAPRNRAEDIKLLVDAIHAQGLDLAKAHAEVRRPWGSYRSLGAGEGWQLKHIAVKPGGRLSLQSHAKRAETWVVASGEAVVTVGDRVLTLNAGQSVHIPLGAKHRLENPGPAPLELIEVQQGSYLGEDDIVRFEDIYGRAPPLADAAE